MNVSQRINGRAITLPSQLALNTVGNRTNRQTDIPNIFYHMKLFLLYILSIICIHNMVSFVSTNICSFSSVSSACSEDPPP